MMSVTQVLARTGAGVGAAGDRNDLHPSNWSA